MVYILKMIRYRTKSQYNTLPRAVVPRRSPATYPRGHGQQLPTSVFLLRVPQMFWHDGMTPQNANGPDLTVPSLLPR